MRYPMSASGTFMPQPPGRTPRGREAPRRCPGGETLLAGGKPPDPLCLPHHLIARLRHDHARCSLARLRHDVPRGRQ
jgi:hypothetical protein